ncbi:hypothetical protein [Hankyongella ginsenosidimutans]|uniref:hypothetical protein n=1 Tax=Hankyongella ginsenosidimutans TaxID=1763828 RepID=UPI001FE7F9C7|nr:hypothetical protein [Hankyongella ginsenosidimutans]
MPASGRGVGSIVVVTDDPARVQSIGVPAGTRIEERSLLDEVQRELREVPGVTAIIYDQTCAAEKRRRRKKS